MTAPRRCWGLFALLLLAGGQLAAPSAAQGPFSDLLTPEERAYVEGRGRITFVHNPASPPFSMGDQDHTKGIVPDIRRLMQARLGISFEIVEAANTTDMIARVLNGSVEVGGTLAITPERAQFVTFTEPYAEIATVAWGPPAALAARERGFVGMDVAVVGASVQESQARAAFPHAVLVPVPSTRAGLDALANGTALAMVGTLPVLVYETQREERFQEFGTLGEPIDSAQLAISMKKGDARLHAIITKGLAAISPEERRAIFIKWTGQDLSPVSNAPAPVDLRLAGIVTGAVLLAGVLVGVPAWVVTLRRRVRKGTQEVQDLNDVLETRVAERTRELERSNAEMEAFAYSVSHDLRAPLRAIDGFSRALVEDAGGTLDPAAQEHLDRIRAASQRMGTLIDELLRLSRIGRAEMSLREVDLTGMARRTLEQLRAADPTRDVRLVLQPDLVAMADAPLLEVALANLLDNAWKFTSRRPAPATITVGRAATPRGDAFFVRDDGAGFEPEFAGKLFAPFQRLHSPSEFPGTGIGLAIVKRIVTRHGGEVWADGKPGEGATFYFTLPRQDPP